MTEDTRRGRSKGSPTAPFPRDTLDAALVLPRGIKDFNAGRPFTRILLADAIGRKPESSAFRGLLRSANKYGLIDGSEKSEAIGLTEVGRRIVEDGASADARRALVQASRQPELLDRIYRHFNQNKLPTAEMASKILQAQFGVPQQLCGLCWDVAIVNGRMTGLVRQVSGTERILLDQQDSCIVMEAPSDAEESVVADEVATPEARSDAAPHDEVPGAVTGGMPPLKVFVAHGKNTKVLEQVKKMLVFAGLEFEVAKDEQTTAIPVPMKVGEAMRRCNAAVICVTADKTAQEQEASGHINQNVLMEIGASFILYGEENVVLLWDRRIDTVPSNLQGRYRLEFEGDELDWDAGMRFMEAVGNIRNGHHDRV